MALRWKSEYIEHTVYKAPNTKVWEIGPNSKFKQTKRGEQKQNTTVFNWHMLLCRFSGSVIKLVLQLNGIN